MRPETQFQAEVIMLETKTNPITENLDSIVITPAKKQYFSPFCRSRLDTSPGICDTYYLYSYMSS